MSERVITPAPQSECAICVQAASVTCPRCRRVRYCSKEHQKQHWADHKIECQCRIMILKGVNLLGDWVAEKLKKDKLLNRFAMTLDFDGGKKDEDLATQICNLPQWILNNSIIIVPDLKFKPNDTREPADFARSATGRALSSYARSGGTVAFAAGEQETCIIPCLRNLFDVDWGCTEVMRAENHASEQAKGPNSIFGQGDHASLICRGAAFTNVPPEEGYWTCEEGAAVIVHKLGEGRVAVFNDLYMDEMTVVLISQLSRNSLGMESVALPHRVEAKGGHWWFEIVQTSLGFVALCLIAWFWRHVLESAYFKHT